MKTVCSTVALLAGFLASQELRIWLRLLRRPIMAVVLLMLMLYGAAWLDSSVARAEIFETLPVCPAGQEYDAGLCYPLCQDGYDGLGPICWKRCPAGYTDDGLTCRRNAHIFGQELYLRTAFPLTCASNLQQQGLLCYPRCSPGFFGDGPVCWKPCPAGYVDDGLTCRRPFPLHIFGQESYGRGAGVPLNSCAGRERIGALCYPPCQPGFNREGIACVKPCPTGYTDDGVTCRRDVHIFIQEAIGRGVGSVPACEVNSFTRNQLPRNPGGNFTLLIASDPQMPWWRTAGDPACNSPECVKQKAIETNRAQVIAMNQITTLGAWPNSPFLQEGRGAPVRKPLGVIVNGDLTAFWHPEEVDLYRQFYDPGAEHADPNVLKLPIYPGLGNHDYFNNVNKGNDPDAHCFGGTADRFYCAKDAVRYIKAMVGCGSVKNFDAAQITSFDRDSLAYSWEIGDYHFVQLNLFPKWENADIGVKTSVPWLKQDLAAATAAGRKIVLNMHSAQSQDVWDNDPVGFVDALKGHNIVAVFAGHIHENFGNRNSAPINGRSVPIFYSGAAEYNTFLLAEFDNNYINVAVIDSSGNRAKYADATKLAGLTNESVVAGELLYTQLVNDAPIAVDSTLSMAVNTPISFGLEAGDSNGDALVFAVTEFPKNGTLSGTAPNLVYTPNQGFVGTDQMTFLIEDSPRPGASPRLTDSAVVKFIVGANANGAPTAVDRTLTLSTTRELSVTVSCVDPENDALTYRVVESPSNGVLTWVGDDQLIYTPLPGFVGEDSFRFVANDGQNDSNGGKVTIIVNPQLAAPTAADQTVMVRENQPTTITLRANDVDSTVLTYTIDTEPAFGTLAQGDGPELLYTPHASFFGEDFFTFHVSDGVNESASARVTLQVQDDDSPPLAHGQTISAVQGVATFLVLTGEDAEGRPITFTLVGPPQHGSLLGEAPDLFYTSADNYVGEDRLLFQVNDGVNNSTPATVTITVLSAPDEAALVGLVFDDGNRNGTLDQGETGLANATVILTGNARAELITYTDAQGGYRFDAVPFGNYTLRILPPAGTKVEGNTQSQVAIQQRGMVEASFIGLTVTQRSLFLPTVSR